MGQELFNYMTSSLDKDFIRGRTHFWNSSNPETKTEYAKLNNISNINEQMIHNIQLRKLTNIATSISSNQKIKKLGEQILKVDQLKIDNGILEETVINEVLKAVQLLFKVGTTKEDKQIIKINESEAAYSRSFIAIEALNELTKNTSGAFSKEVLEKTSNLLSKYKSYVSKNGEKYWKALKNTGFGTDEDLLWFFRNLKSIQGSLMEERATEWLSEKIPQIQEITGKQMAVLNTGLLNFGGKQPAVDISLIKLDETVKIKCRIGKAKSFKEVSLKDFLNLVESSNNTSERIALNDESIDILSKLMQLNIQAKSGKGQKPFNKIQITLSDLGIPQTALGKMSASKIFYSFQQLERETWIYNKQQITKEDDGTYSAIANYALSTRIGDIMNYGLNISKDQMNNQFLLTPQGFMTYGERMKELLGTTEYIQLKGEVDIESSMMQKSHEVVMPHPFWYYYK